MAVDSEQTSEMLLAFGGEIKALGDGRIGGYLVHFTGPDAPDLEGDYFDASTDYGIEDGDRIGVYYNHGLDATLKKRRLSRGTLTKQDVGIWIETQLDMRDEYERAIYSMIEEAKLGWSSGSMAHLIEREPVEKAYHIKQWPIGEGSITPTPAAGPILTQVQPLKTWAEATETLEALTPQAAGNAAADAGQPDAGRQPDIKILDNGDTPMSDEVEGTVLEAVEETPAQTLEHDEGLKLMRGQIDDLTKAVNSLLQYAQDAPAIRKAGYITEDGGKADAGRKSFGDWLMAVRRNDAVRLKTVYGSTKALAEESGVTGGYLVPEGFEPMLLQVAAQNSIVRSRATIFPGAAASGKMTSLDQTTAPTGGVGHSAFAGGVVAAWGPEAGTIGETTPAFKQISWEVEKLSGYTKASNEITQDSATSIESMLVTMFGRAIAAMEDYAFLRGDGAGKPLGILNAPCTIAVTTAGDNAFVMADAMNLLAQFWPYLGRTVWIMHNGMITDLAGSTFGTTGNAMPLIEPRTNTGGINQLAQPLLGYPVLFSEHMPNPNTDDVILADLSAYCIWDRGGTAIAFSEHAFFTTDEAAWRFTKRLDGKPWLNSYITLGSPSSFTVSPFLYHND